MAEEKGFENRLVIQVKKSGGLALKIWGVSFVGMPDRILLLPGAKVYFVELKSVGKHPSEIQHRRIKFLRQLGFIVYVINSKESLDQCLLEIKK